MGSTRKVIRKALAALFVAEGSFTGGVFAYAPVDLQGMSPVLAIYSGTSHHTQESYASEHSFYTDTLDVYVKRVGGEDAEDTLSGYKELDSQSEEIIFYPLTKESMLEDKKEQAKESKSRKRRKRK